MTDEETKEYLRGRLDDQKEVIREFYHELYAMGVMPRGIYRWDKKDARQFARDLVAKAIEDAVRKEAAKWVD